MPISRAISSIETSSLQQLQLVLLLLLWWLLPLLLRLILILQLHTPTRICETVRNTSRYAITKGEGGSYDYERTRGSHDYEGRKVSPVNEAVKGVSVSLAMGGAGGRFVLSREGARRFIRCLGRKALLDNAVEREVRLLNLPSRRQ